MADFEDIFFDDLIDALYQKRREQVRDTSDEHDVVNHPDYYCSGGIETLDYILAKKMDFLLGQVCKYISRAGYTETSGCDFFPYKPQGSTTPIVPPCYT